MTDTPASQQSISDNEIKAFSQRLMLNMNDLALVPIAQVPIFSTQVKDTRFAANAF
jgi:hypothetical protein